MSQEIPMMANPNGLYLFRDDQDTAFYTPITPDPNLLAPTFIQDSYPSIPIPVEQQFIPTIATPSTMAGSPVSTRKRAHEDESTPATPSTLPKSQKKKRRRTSCNRSGEIAEENRLLMRLKKEGLNWRGIVARFYEDLGKEYQIATLQMRYKRLRDAVREWDQTDTDALKQAHKYYVKVKWEMIASKMNDFGTDAKWSPQFLQQKFEELHLASDEPLSPQIFVKEERQSLEPGAMMYYHG